MNVDTQFLNGAFGIESQRDTRNVMTQFRACQKTYCNDCMDEFGRCIICAEKNYQKQSLIILNIWFW